MSSRVEGLAWFGAIGAWFGMRAGLFGKKEVDADMIIYGLGCDYALKRRLCVIENRHWGYDYDYIKTRRPPRLKGGMKWRYPSEMPNNEEGS